MVAAGYAAVGDSDRAQEWLERTVAEREFGIVSLRSNPAFDGIRSERALPTTADKHSSEVANSFADGRGLCIGLRVTPNGIKLAGSTCLKFKLFLGFGPFTRALYRELAAWLLPTALETDHGPELHVWN